MTGYCHNVLCLSYPLQPDCILALYKRSGDCLNLYAILGNTDSEWLLIQLFRVYMSSPRCKSWWDNNLLPAFGLFVISSSLFMRSVGRTARIFTCRPTIPYRGFCVLSAFYSVAVTWPITECKKRREAIWLDSVTLSLVRNCSFLDASSVSNL